HGATVIFDADCALVRERGKALKKGMTEQLPHRLEELGPARIHEGDPVVAVEKNDAVGGGFEELSYLATKTLGLQNRLACWQRRSVNVRDRSSGGRTPAEWCFSVLSRTRRDTPAYRTVLIA